MREKIKDINKKIDKICKDRDLEYLSSMTSEIFHWNSFYGIDKIIKEYAGVPKTYSIKGVWPHGLVFDKSVIHEKEKETPLPVVFCYPPYRAQTYQTQTDKTVILSAHPFLYLLDLVDFKPENREGTIFFPQHSTHDVTAEMDYDALADRLVSLDEEYQPVTVCLYWKDYLMGRAEPFTNRGLPVVSAGHIYDQSFLRRFYELCACHEYASGNSIGSHIFLSVVSGCSYFHVDSIGYKLSGKKEQIKGFKKEKSIKSKIEDTFVVKKPKNNKEQAKEARRFLGAEYKKSPRILLMDIIRAEAMDKLEFKKEKRSYLYYTKFIERSSRNIKERLKSLKPW